MTFTLPALKGLNCGLFSWCADDVTANYFLLQVLLGLTDEDLELGLGINSPMHRRKLRLAIEDYREAENGRGLEATYTYSCQKQNRARLMLALLEI